MRRDLGSIMLGVARMSMFVPTDIVLLDKSHTDSTRFTILQVLGRGLTIVRTGALTGARALESVHGRRVGRLLRFLGSRTKVVLKLRVRIYLPPPPPKRGTGHTDLTDTD